MTALARLAGVSLDAADPAELATFYSKVLDIPVVMESEDFIALKGDGIYVTVQRVAAHRAPDWPEGASGKQLHFELSVKDLDESEDKIVALGATKPTEQPSPESWRVLRDPAGHPFCITTLIPDE